MLIPENRGIGAWHENTRSGAGGSNGSAIGGRFIPNAALSSHGNLIFCIWQGSSEAKRGQQQGVKWGRAGLGGSLTNQHEALNYLHIMNAFTPL